MNPTRFLLHRPGAFRPRGAGRNRHGHHPPALGMRGGAFVRRLAGAALAFSLSGCGIVYQSPELRGGTTQAMKVRVVPITAESVLLANRTSYHPHRLPAVFSRASGGGVHAASALAALPLPALAAPRQPGPQPAHLPPPATPGRYKIGVGDVVRLSTPASGGSVARLTGLLAAQTRRQGYTVQDDGAIAVPGVGRIRIAGLSVDEAESEVFRQLAKHQINPTFSLEISAFNAYHVSVGGAVKAPAIVPITLAPLTLDDALAAAGGLAVSDRATATVRLFRDGRLYRIPVAKLLSGAGAHQIRLLAGDSIFVDDGDRLDRARAYFEEQIALSRLRQDRRRAALEELNAEVARRRAARQEARANFLARLKLGAIRRDYVYLTGEVGTQGRYALPFEQTASLADALYDTAGGIPARTGNPREIYVLRGASDPRKPASVTAWQLDGRNVANAILATRFQMRPNDVIFVAEQPVTRWSRVIEQITPSLISASFAAAKN